MENNEKTQKHIERNTHIYAESSMNVHLSQRMTNENVYIGILKLANTEGYQRLQFADHTWRHDEELAYDIISW